MSVLAVLPSGVYVTVHVDDVPAPLNVQAGLENLPVAALVSTATVPVGASSNPVSVSVTVIVQVVAVPVETGLGVQLILVVVLWRLTVIVVCPLLPVCPLSPA